MKITRTKTEIFDIDLETEQARLKKYFKGKQLARQQAIFDAMFVEKDLGKVQELYDALPYCKRSECPEQEYVGAWITIFTGGDWGEWPIETDITYNLK